MDRTTEIRKLPAAAIFKLSQILDTANAWEKVMAMIPSDPNDLESEPKYTLQHIKLIKSASEKQNKSCTEILLDEWGTSGKVRPNLSTLLQILVKAQFYRAAEYVAVDLLKDVPPERPLHGPAAAVDLPPIRDEIRKESDIRFEDVLHVPYATLEMLTNNFDESPLMKCVHEDGFIHFVSQPWEYLVGSTSESGSTLMNVLPKTSLSNEIWKYRGPYSAEIEKKKTIDVRVNEEVGHKLGVGAFGSVYYGETKNGNKIAVKKLSTSSLNLKNQFENEIKTLSEYRHVNLVSLLGYSCDTDNYCLVYEFMSSGSLLDKLQLKSYSVTFCDSATSFSEKPLTWIKRTGIAIDVCEGIHFLHTSKKFPLIHRDIKSANILLDEHLTAKVGDFGLVKVKPNVSESKLLTSNVFGTSAYMAPEAFRGDVSVKMDVFSFGVVLLELLTGLPPYDENRDGCDLVTYIEDVVEDSIEFLLDKKAGEWDKLIAQQMFTLSQACLEEKRSRPLMGEVRQKLESLWGSIPTVNMTITL